MKNKLNSIPHSLRTVMLLFIALLSSVVHATNYINDVYVYTSDYDYEGSTMTVNNNRNYYVVRDGSTNIDMNEEARGKYIFVAYSYTDNPADAITGLVVYKGGSTEDCPASLSYGGKTYYPVSHNDYGNLNRGADSDAPNLYLFYTKEGNTQSGVNVLTGLSGLYASSKDNNSSYVKFHNGEVADMNDGAGGKYVYLIPSYSTVTRKNPSFSTSTITCTLVDAPVLPTLNRDGHTGTVTYSSDNPSVAKVDSSNGTITIGNTLGKAVITASFPNADNLFAASCSYSITTVRKDASISFSQTSYSLNALSSIENTLNIVSNGDVTYISDNPSVVTIDSKGKITAVGAGTTKVHASTPQTNEYNAAEASADVTVATIANNLAFDNSSYSLEVNTKVKTSYTSLDTKTIPTYESSNPSVATVDANGEITAVGPGKATIAISQAATSVYSASSTSVTVYVCNYLCFTAEEANSTISFNASGNGGSGNVQTSTDGFNWSDYTRSTIISLMNVGDKVYLKGDYRGTSRNSYSGFAMTGKIAASGNIMTLTDGDIPTKSLKDKKYAFCSLFYKSKALTSAPELPATTLDNHCYDNMFMSCTALTSAPALPATTLANYCYANMFHNCKSLTSAPALPATTLDDYCYEYMFMGCTALTSAPALPATTLTDDCYHGMFSSCTALTSAPELPATTLANYCYYGMFDGCTKLNYIKVAFTDWNSATDATSDWVYGVATTGTFICPAELAKEFGDSHIPEGWTVASSYTLPRSYRFSTFSSSMATDFSGSGLTPYYVSDKNEARTSVILKPFADGIVPAGQGAVLYNANITDGTSENFTVKVTAASGTTPAVNYLKPALTAIVFPSASSVEEAGYKYMLGDEDKWWWINGGTLAAGKAYLDLSSNPSAAKAFFMIFDEETTAISSISNEKLGKSNSSDAYNLAGQKVGKDYKGIVIKNGKKIVK